MTARTQGETMRITPRFLSSATAVALLVALAACTAAPAPPLSPELPAVADPVPNPAPGGPTPEAPAPEAPSAPAERTCELPAAGARFEEANPAEVGIEPEIARAVTETVAARLTSSFRIYRHGCLVARNLLDEAVKDTPLPFFSMTKTVVALAVGRAIELGHLELHDPISKYVPQADAAHGRITVYQLLTQTSGLRFAWGNDLLGSVNDGVGTALSMPPVYQPGTTFQYAQTTVSLLAYVVGRAAGQDFQDFVRTEIFEPIGIRRSEWVWERDKAGNTHGYAWLSMTPAATARLGFLTLEEGRWNDQQLIDSGYIHDMGEGTKANESYGYLMPTNRGDGGYTSFGNQRFEGPRNAAAPRDTVNFSGFLDQSIAVVPSLDLVVVRLGFPAGNGWEYEMFRQLMPGISGVDYDDPGPYVHKDVDVPIEQIVDFPLLIAAIVNANQYD